MTIELGSTGPYVSVWQRLVGAHVDGDFGPATDVKVRAWQTARGVEPDGVVGSVTRAALLPGDLIKPYEGLRLYPYDDHDGRPLHLDGARQWRRPDGALVMGYPTIGWGRRLFPGEYVTSCTKAEADAWFDSALKGTFLPAARRAISEGLQKEIPGVTGDAGQLCAATSFPYNCGTGALARLTAARFDKAVWLDFCRTKGVVNAGLQARRAEEYALWAPADGTSV